MVREHPSRCTVCSASSQRVHTWQQVIYIRKRYGMASAQNTTTNQSKRRGANYCRYSTVCACMQRQYQHQATEVRLQYYMPQSVQHTCDLNVCRTCICAGSSRNKTAFIAKYTNPLFLPRGQLLSSTKAYGITFAPMIKRRGPDGRPAEDWCPAQK
jgi:hypothetical protein